MSTIIATSIEREPQQRTFNATSADWTWLQGLYGRNIDPQARELMQDVLDFNARRRQRDPRLETKMRLLQKVLDFFVLCPAGIRLAFRETPDAD